METKQPLEFNDYFLSQRLARVKSDVFKKFVSTWQEDIRKNTTQKQLIEEIVNRLKIFKNNAEFIDDFKSFFQEYVLSGKVSEYLLKIEDKKSVIQWLTSLTKETGGFSGHQYNFILYSHLELREKLLNKETDHDDINLVGKQNQKENNLNIYYPTQVILLIAVNKDPKPFSNGLETVYLNPTVEFEVIFRKDLEFIEVRGQFNVIRDFVNSAILNQDNPLHGVKSIFIGDKPEDKKSPNSSIVEPVRFVKIEALKKSINGSYLSVSSPVNGSKTSRVTLTLESLNSIDDETEPTLRNILQKTIKDSDQTKLSFNYKNQDYSFGITKSGGLTFMKYTEEEVITYILQQIIVLLRS